MSTREELLQEIIDAVDPIDELSEDTVIAESEDLDSLGLFNIVILLKGKGLALNIDHLKGLKTLGDIIDLMEKGA